MERTFRANRNRQKLAIKNSSLHIYKTLIRPPVASLQKNKTLNRYASTTRVETDHKSLNHTLSKLYLLSLYNNLELQSRELSVRMTAACQPQANTASARHHQLTANPTPKVYGGEEENI